MEDVFFIIGSSKGQGKEIFELLKPESVEIIQFDSFDDLTESTYKLSPTFVLVDRSFDIECLKKGINSLNKCELKPIIVLLTEEQLSNSGEVDYINLGFDGFIVSGQSKSWVLAYLKSLFRLYHKNRLQNTDQQFRLLFETMFSAYALHEIITDESGKAVNYRYLEVNPAFEKITGYKAEEVVGKTLIDLFPDSSSRIIETYGEVALDGKKLQFEQYSPDLKKHFEVVAFSPKKGQFSTVFIDITEYKEAIKIIRDSENSLKEMNEAKDRFFSIVAHDLKNPFHNILGFADLLTEDYHSMSDEEILSQINHIKTATENAYTLLINLLDWSRVLLNRIDLQADTYDLKELIDQEVKILKEQIDQKNLALNIEVNDAVQVYVDNHMIGTVVRNLLSNAIKFSNVGQQIEIYSTDLAKFWQLSIKDDGVGIPVDKIDGIFGLDKHKSTLGTAKEKGTGLGLILCKEFVEKNGGKIWVESTYGTGTTFHFIMPKNRS